ncbi:MAG TPA: SLC13 family permease [Anaerolineales bacterium]
MSPIFSGFPNLTASQILLILIVLIPLGMVFANRLRVDLAALLIAVALGIAQFLGGDMLGPAGSSKDAAKAISGFGQPVVTTLISLFILTRALDKSGVTRWIARKLIVYGGASESRLIFLFATTTAALSLFMNNLAAGALILPSAMEVARRTGVKPSKLLIPVAYGSLLGGAATYFTTANIIISDLLRSAKPAQEPLRVFDFTPVGGLMAIAGIAFLAYFGKRLLPNRQPAAEQMMTRMTGSELEDLYKIGERLWEARVQPGSQLAGMTLAQAAIGRKLGVEVAAIWHGRQAIFPPAPDQVISTNDILLLVGREERVSRLLEVGLAIGRENRNEHISPFGVTMLEIVLAPHSKALGRTLKELDFRRRFGFTVVALRRLDRSYRTEVGDFPLAMGDSLLLIGPRNQLRSLQKDLDFIVLQPSLSDQPLERRPVYLSSGIVLAAITASILGFPVYLAMLLGAIVIVTSGVLSMEEAYQSIEWQAVFMIAGMYSVSLAMVETGLAAELGGGVVRLAEPFGPLGLAAGAYILSAMLTQLMGGQVTALVTGPVAISAAIGMGVSPQAVAVATAIGCSASFFTPFAHPVNILMIAPANYTFSDFLHIGWRLTLLSFVVFLVGMVLFWRL